jgi:hypothetical protein
MLTAHLSDGSAPDFVDTGFSSAGQYDVVYTLNYLAASAGQQLNVMWTLFSGVGNVTLQGAALPGAPGKTTDGCGIWVDDSPPPVPWAAATTLGMGDRLSDALFRDVRAPVCIGHRDASAHRSMPHPAGGCDRRRFLPYLDPTNPPSE